MNATYNLNKVYWTVFKRPFGLYARVPTNEVYHTLLFLENSVKMHQQNACIFNEHVLLHIISL